MPASPAYYVVDRSLAVDQSELNLVNAKSERPPSLNLIDYTVMLIIYTLTAPWLIYLISPDMRSLPIDNGNNYSQVPTSKAKRIRGSYTTLA